MTFFIMQSDATCREEASTGPGTSSPPTAPSSWAPIVIAASVGINGTNRVDDVVRIQDALNRVPTISGGASPSLIVDGQCGPKTKKAIQLFQIKHFGWGGADGLVEPNRQTIAKLNQILGANQVYKADAIDSQAYFVGPGWGFLNISIQLARTCVSAAQSNIFQVSPVLEGLQFDPIFGFDRDLLMKLLNKHFELDKFGTKRRQIYDYLRTNFDRMQQVLQLGLDVFEAGELDGNPIAFTTGAGFFQRGKFHWVLKGKIRQDAIYICPRFYTLYPNVSKGAIVIVHELAHFVGHPELIRDHGKIRQTVTMKYLPPILRIRNADSYAIFAFEAAHPGASAPVF